MPNTLHLESRELLCLKSCSKVPIPVRICKSISSSHSNLKKPDSCIFYITICITEKSSTLQMAFQAVYFLSLLFTGFFNALGISKLKLQFCPMLYSHDKISAADFVVEVQNPTCILSLLTFFQVLEKEFPYISQITEFHFVSHVFYFLKCFSDAEGFRLY